MNPKARDHDVSWSALNPRSSSSPRCLAERKWHRIAPCFFAFQEPRTKNPNLSISPCLQIPPTPELEKLESVKNRLLTLSCEPSREWRGTVDCGADGWVGSSPPRWPREGGTASAGRGIDPPAVNRTKSPQQKECGSLSRLPMVERSGVLDGNLSSHDSCVSNFLNLAT
jgi:hypothetical protein